MGRVFHERLRERRPPGGGCGTAWSPRGWTCRRCGPRRAGSRG